MARHVNGLGCGDQFPDHHIVILTVFVPSYRRLGLDNGDDPGGHSEMSSLRMTPSHFSAERDSSKTLYERSDARLSGPSGAAENPWRYTPCIIPHHPAARVPMGNVRIL
jgi:hypothetical protein